MNNVIDIKLQALSEGKVFGAISLKLRNCTNGTMCTFVIPIEIEVHTGLVAVTFEPMSTCDESGSIISLSLRNDGPKLLRVVGVTEDDRNGPMIFQVKYLNGLILFPDTVTDIVLVRYTSSVPEGVSFDSCNIVVETNSTLGSSIIIPCKDLLCASISYTNNAIVAESDGRLTRPLYEEVIAANARTGILGSILQVEDNNVKHFGRGVRPSVWMSRVAIRVRLWQVMRGCSKLRRAASCDIHLQVTKVKISGADCGVDGFTVDNCKGFSLAPSESLWFREIFELVMTTGIFPIPMTANIPACMLNQCRKPYLRSSHWKLLVFFFGALTLLVWSSSDMPHIL
ncbi:hypothetical protein U9M48_034664 [Paspalum notatum var. saurae]|uniref:Uncharacterized protein n=1 Tax=Paspalum notatum var. saurae TaxID=547442 RepID=A0AAQ3U9K4_PASNO